MVNGSPGFLIHKSRAKDGTRKPSWKIKKEVTITAANGSQGNFVREC
jgi:hypothetical protein